MKLFLDDKRNPPNYNSYQLYVPFLDFIVRYEMFSDEDILHFKKMLANAFSDDFIESALQDACNKFIAQLDYIRENGSN